MASSKLTCADFDFNGHLGSDGAEITQLAENKFKISLGHAPNHTDWANMLQFVIHKNAAGQQLTLEVAFDGGTSYAFDSYFYSFSYNGQDWFPIHWEEEKNGQKNTLTFPPFAQDTVYFGHQVPLSNADHIELIESWRAERLVNVEILGQSLQGRDIHRVTIQDPESPLSEADKDTHYFANQHPGEHNAQWRMVGMIKWLLSDEARQFLRDNTCHFVLMMSPDAPYHGWYRTNAEGIDMNRSYHKDGSDQEKQTHEAFVCQRDLEYLASQTGLTTVWGMHTWGGIVEPLMICGPEYENSAKEWEGLRDTVQKHDQNQLCKPIKLKDTEKKNYNYWDVGPHHQFDITTFLCEGGGAIYTKEENMESGEVLIRGLLEFYST